jgi:23S rRNA (cytidine1920-2'-O)/16S rRNA (cytidine1409-2'-O)-methyltransferase
VRRARRRWRAVTGSTPNWSGAGWPAPGNRRPNWWRPAGWRCAARSRSKPAAMVDPADAVLGARRDGEEYVIRGRHKLAGALAAFPSCGWTVRRCLDAAPPPAASPTCCCGPGAAEVVAVDVGYGQLAWALRQRSPGRGARAHQRAYAHPGGDRGGRPSSSSPTCRSSPAAGAAALTACTTPDGD